MALGGGGGRGVSQRGAEARIALVGGVHEQRRLLDQLVRLFGGGGLAVLLVGAEEILRELRARELVEEQLGVVEVLPELADDLVGAAAEVRVLLPRQRARRQQHRRERPPRR